jgi:hypothetical protein
MAPFVEERVHSNADIINSGDANEELSIHEFAIPEQSVSVLVRDGFVGANADWMS